jgi:sulfoxide reductase heme-binding subunit YedZ
VGLWAFAYVCLHLSTYLGVDQAFDWPTIGKDIAKRPYITIGMAAFAMLLPMAITSLDRLRRKLGPMRWKRLHQAIYLIAPMGATHYFLLVKADHRPPLVYGAVIAVLLVWHAVNFGLDRKKAAERKAAQEAKKAAQDAKKAAAKAGAAA